MEGSVCVRCNTVGIKQGKICQSCEDDLLESYNVSKEIEPFKESNNVRHLKILDEIHRIYEAKNGDYGDSFSKLYKEYGMLSSIIRLSDKLERLKTLRTKTQLVNDESVRDTLIDLCGYAIMTVMELDNE